MPNASFGWNGATVTVRARTGRVEVYKGHLRRIAGAYEDDVTELRASELLTATHYLAHVQSVTGDLGFNIPTGDPTRQALHAFTDALLDSPAALLDAWDSTIAEANEGGNEPDLLPPDAVPDTKKKTRT